MLISASGETKEAIVDAVFNLSSNKIGALITLEQHNSLDQYAQRAIQLNSDISKELLEQIFIKDSPLHDGGVIIRGNKIVCAGAYYVLTQDDSLDKTVGSRHRAGVGISEVTDSLTIIVSEETGIVHVANAGFMKIMDNKNELLEYLNLFLGR
jgi:diadenylate cyclase